MRRMQDYMQTKVVKYLPGEHLTFILLFFTSRGESWSTDSLNLKYRVRYFAIHFLRSGFP